MTEEERAALLREIAETKASAAQVRKILDTIPTLASCNLPDGSNEFLNQRWHDYTGLSPQEARGRGWRVTIHPEDLQKVLDTFRALQASGEPRELEHRLRRHDGEYRWFLFRIEPLRDELGNIVRWYATNTDIENLKRTEEKLRQDERELRRITDAIPHSIVIQQPDGTPIYANQAVLDYSGFTMEDVVASDFRARRKDGQYRWFLIRYNPFRDEQGRLVRWYATGTDIDDRKRMEDRVRNENVALREDIVRSSMFEEIVGSSEPLRRVLAQVEKVAPTVSTVLILGETGTGKELIARAIHSRSKRSGRAFIRVNCAAIPPPLVASELFGHEKGAFTGALQRRLGRFESADGGTLFLDEVGELPPEAQVALLRVLQDREFERVGGSHTISVDVRVLAATNRDLGAAVAEGAFRQDLFYRLNVFPIRMPALRERGDDIPILVKYLVNRYAERAGKSIRHINKRTLDLFQAYDWPGNVRELQNVIERAVILCDGETFAVDDTWLAPVVVPHSVATGSPLVANLVEHEREVIEHALREAEGVIGGPAGAAAKLGIPRQTLESKIKKLGIKRYRFKTS